MKLSKPAFWLLLLGSLCALTIAITNTISLQRSHTDYVYVDNIQLFNNFDMTKDLGESLKIQLKKPQQSLDSLINIYEILKDQPKTKIEKLSTLEGQIRELDFNLRQQQQQLSGELNQQVWTRLNGYLKSYGEDHSHQIILGTQGNGSIMYAHPDKDITEDVLIYVNQKYEAQ